MGALHAELSQFAPDDAAGLAGWPKTARGLGSALDRLAPALRAAGYLFERRIQSGRVCVTLVGPAPPAPRAGSRPGLRGAIKANLKLNL